MPRRILIIQGHPDPKPARLCRGLAEAYAAGAREAGHRVEELDLAALDIPLLRSQGDYQKGTVPESLRPAQQAIGEAEHIVLIFPLWLGTMPALVKAFLEQVLRPGFAFVAEGKGFPKGRLKGRSARLVVTMGMPAFAYRWFYGAHGLRGITRNILHFVGIKPVRLSLFGTIGTASAARRERWLAEMRRLGEQAR